MVSDDEIEQVLAQLGPLDWSRVPLYGEWQARPFKDQRIGTSTLAVVHDDPGVVQMTVERETGRVFLVPDGEEPELMNSGLAELIACARLWSAAQSAAAEAEDDPALEALGTRLMADLRRADPVALANENGLWSLAAEELAHGM